MIPGEQMIKMQLPWGTGATLHIPFYEIGGRKGWSATAILLAEFVALLNWGV